MGDAHGPRIHDHEHARRRLPGGRVLEDEGPSVEREALRTGGRVRKTPVAHEVELVQLGPVLGRDREQQRVVPCTIPVPPCVTSSGPSPAAAGAAASAPRTHSASVSLASMLLLRVQLGQRSPRGTTGTRYRDTLDTDPCPTRHIRSRILIACPDHRETRPPGSFTSTRTPCGATARSSTTTSTDSSSFDTSAESRHTKASPASRSA